MRLVGVHVNFNREKVADLVGNIQIQVLNSDPTLLPVLVNSNILGQMYRYDVENRGELERSLYSGTSKSLRRRRREILERRRASKLCSHQNREHDERLCTATRVM